jgi:carbonic anhydrase/acetyltransferase-like protein (isoleucine patch superfamily)
MTLYIFEEKTPQVADNSYLHPQATVIGDVTIGSHCFIGPGAVLRGDLGTIAVGDGTNIQDNCVIHADREVLIGEDIIIGHGAIIHDVTLKPGVVVGMGAILMSGVVAEEDVIIGAGSVVKENFKISPRKIVVGNPGRVVKEIDEEGKKKVVCGLMCYKDLTDRYIKGLQPVKV